MSPLVSCFLLVFITVVYSGVPDPQGISLKLSWVTETRMELMIGERRRNILLTPTTNIPGWKTSCLFTGKLEGDLDSEVSVSGCHNSKETMVSIDSSLLFDGFVELMIVDGHTKNVDSPSISGETEGEESQDDYIEALVDPFESAVPFWSGPLPSTVALKTDIKYDNSLLEHFDYSHEKTKDWLNKVIRFAKPWMSHNSLTIKVVLEIGEVSHIDETLAATSNSLHYLARKKHNTLTSYFCNNNGDGTTGSTYRGAACSRRSAFNIVELSRYPSPDRETAKTFAHELGHTIGMYHDHHEIHGGHIGECNHQGLMSYGRNRRAQWSSCSDDEFTKWWKQKGHACLKKISNKHHEVSCGNHEASNCGGCPQGNGKHWCNGDCRWVHGQCVAKSGTGAGPDFGDWGNW